MYTALQLIRQYGETAATEAAMFGFELREIGDLEGWRFWDTVYRAICQIECGEAQVGDVLH
ncbi:MAG: hypothetical protein TEF_04025 [Rhizobiales bacterium NRL2]|nr:MAG: hypothetical protein TEF_04025 [Rhizobiales bacterium NRL2]